MTKVTDNIYSCDTCHKSREMMEMDDLDSAKCQKNPRLEDMMGIKLNVNEEEDKIANSDHLLHEKETKT